MLILKVFAVKWLFDFLLIMVKILLLPIFDLEDNAITLSRQLIDKKFISCVSEVSSMTIRINFTQKIVLHNAAVH